MSRADVRTETGAGRWTVRGRHTVQVGTGALSQRAQLWRAVWESGSGAVLDGAAALLAGGLTGFAVRSIDVSVARNNRRHRVEGVTLHHRVRLAPVIQAGIPRVRPEQAVIHAARWARTDREGILVLCLAVQQRRVAVDRLLAAWHSAPAGGRQQLLALAIVDICDGAHSLGELDVVTRCRARGLPDPSRQVVRRGPKGRIYLDLGWEDIGLAVEVDGGHHALGLNTVDDALRQNEVAIGDETILRVPVLGWRLEADAFLDQIVRAHAALSARAAA